MKQASRILIGLATGSVIGLFISATQSPALLKIVPAVEPAGTVWVGLLNMTVVPLVVSLLITSIASASDSGKLGRIAGKALLVFFLLYVLVAALTTFISPFLFAGLPFAPERLASLKESIGSTTAEPAGTIAHSRRAIHRRHSCKPLRPQPRARYSRSYSSPCCSGSRLHGSHLRHARYLCASLRA